MLAKPLTFTSHFLHPFKTIRRKVASTFQHTTTSAITVSMTTGWCRGTTKKPSPIVLVLQTFIHIDETGTGRKIIQIKNLVIFYWERAGGASWMQAKEEQNKH